MIRIVEGLYLGNREAARDLRRLREAGITHVVNCSTELPNYHEGCFEYLALDLTDPDPTMHAQIGPACAFIDAARRRRGRVLVHCFAGVSRSPSVVLAYLCHLGDTLEEAADRLGAVVWTDPDLLFLRQVAEHFGEETDSERLLRLSCTLLGRPLEAS